MPLKKDVVTAPYDLADYVGDAEDVRTTIAVAFEDGDPTTIIRALGAVARSKGMTTIAEKTGLQRESLYKSLSEVGNPEFRTLVKVLDALGLALAVRPKPDEASERLRQAAPARGLAEADAAAAQDVAVRRRRST